MSDVERLLIGVDPGLMTGVAWLLDDDTFESCDLPALDACDRIARLFSDHWNGGDQDDCRPIVIAVERYSITQQTVKLTRQYDALEVIGVCRWIARYHGASFLLQGASAAQRVGNRDVLRTLGWWKPGGDHLNKAAAQVALAYQQTFPHEFAKRLEPGTII